MTRAPSSLTQPDLPRQRAADRPVDRRRHLPRQRRASRARPRADLRRDIVATGDAGRQNCARPAPKRSRRWRGSIADAPKLKAAVDTDDPPTVQHDRRRLPAPARADLLLVTNRAGAVLAWSERRRRPRPSLAAEPAIRSALDGRDAVSLLAAADGMLQVVTVPISLGLAQPEILGTLSVGFLLDDTLAAQLKAVTGSEIAFGTGRRDSRHHPARGGAPDARRRLLGATDGSPRHPRRGGVRRAGPARRSGAGDPVDRGPAPTALILRSRTDQLRFLQRAFTPSWRSPPSSRCCWRRSSASPSPGRSPGRSRRSPRHARGRRHRRPDPQDRAAGGRPATTRTPGCWPRPSTR